MAAEIIPGLAAINLDRRATMWTWSEAHRRKLLRASTGWMTAGRDTVLAEKFAAPTYRTSMDECDYFLGDSGYQGLNSQCG